MDLAPQRRRVQGARQHGVERVGRRQQAGARRRRAVPERLRRARCVAPFNALSRRYARQGGYILGEGGVSNLGDDAWRLRVEANGPRGHLPLAPEEPRPRSAHALLRRVPRGLSPPPPAHGRRQSTPKHAATNRRRSNPAWRRENLASIRCPRRRADHREAHPRIERPCAVCGKPHSRKPGALVWSDRCRNRRNYLQAAERRS